MVIRRSGGITTELRLDEHSVTIGRTWVNEFDGASMRALADGLSQSSSVEAQDVATWLAEHADNPVSWSLRSHNQRVRQPG